MTKTSREIRQKSSIFWVFPGFLSFGPGFTLFFPGKPAPGGQISSDCNSLPPRLETHQKPAGRRDHGDHEPGPGISLGGPDRLAEITKDPVHPARTVADTQQDRWTLGMGPVCHDS
jgi:hypothetical protein